MKMRNLGYSFISLLIVAVVFVSCKKEDTVAPYITLEGDNPLTIILNKEWIDPGATAMDNFDKDISSRIQVTHDIPINGVENGEGPTKQTGTYTVTYSVKDAADNRATKTRTVKVVNSAEKYMGDFECDRVGNNVHIALNYNNQNRTLTSDKGNNWMFRLPKLCGITALKVNAYIDRDEEGQTIPSTADVPGGYQVSIIQQEFWLGDTGEGAKDNQSDPGDTIYYKISGFKGGQTYQQCKLDTTGTDAKYVFEIKYDIEQEYPYSHTAPNNPNNKENDVVTETYYYKY